MIKQRGKRLQMRARQGIYRYFRAPDYELCMPASPSIKAAQGSGRPAAGPLPQGGNTIVWRDSSRSGRISMKREAYYMKRLEVLAFFLGAVAIPSTLLIPVIAPFIFASMAIVFAVLSKGGNMKFSRIGKIAFCLGIAAIIINIVYLWYAVRTLSETLSDPTARAQLNETLYRQYGMTLDEPLEQLPSQPLLK